MTYDAGKAVASYQIDTAQAEAAAQRIRQIWQGIAQSQQTFGSGGSGGQRALPAGQDLAAQYTAQQRAAAQLEATQSRLARAQGDTAGSAALLGQAEQRLLALLQRENLTFEQSIAVQKQLAGVQTQIAKGSQQSGTFAQQFGDSLRSSFLGIVGPAALATAAIGAVYKTVQGAQQSVADALQLRETKNSLAAVAGDTRTYTSILKEARDQQVLFGGSLQENISGLQGLAVVARASGADLATLIDFQRRLTTLDPEQGATGAKIALNEALSGNVASLSRRFEIPKAQLQQLNDATIPVSQRLQALDEFLNHVGITSEAVTGKVDQDATAFRRLGQELGDAALKGGDRLASSLGSSANALARLVGVVNGNPQAIAELGSLLSGKPIVGGKGGTADQIQAIQALDAAQAQLRNGIGGNVASGKLGDQQAEAERLLTMLNYVGDRSAVAGQQATQAFIQSGQSADQYIAKLRELVGQTQSQAVSQQQATDKVAADAKAKLDAEIETKRLADYQRQLEADSLAAARGLLGAGDQALILANKYHYTADEAQYLIDKQTFIANQGSKKVTPTDDSRSSSDAQARVKAVLDSQTQLALAGAKNSAQKIAILKGELGRTTDTIERNRILAQIASEEQTRVAGGVSTAQKLNDIALSSGIDRAKIERENLERLADQEQDFNLRRTRSQEDYERQRRKLLAEGKVFEARQLKETFDREQQRAQQDFDISRQRTIRNNAESLGDQSTRVGVQIGKATRGKGGTAGAVDLGGAPQAPIALTGGASSGPATRIIQIQLVGAVNLDGEKLGELIYPHIQPLIEDDIVIDLQSAGITAPPGSRQSAVAGARP